MSRKRLLLVVFLLVAGFSLLAEIPAHAQSVEYDCQATLQSLAASNPELHCTCACATCRASCSQGGSGSSGRSSAASMNDIIKQQVAATVVDAFIKMLFSTDSKAAAQKQQMMAELARRQAEAERQHKIEEALRLQAICNRLESTLKLNGLPGLKLKDVGTPASGLRLKLGDDSGEHVGIKGLPGIALNDNTGNGGNTPYGIKGLPGIYTNGPGSPSGSAAPSSSGLKLKIGEESAPPEKLAGDPVSTTLPADDALPPSLADGIRDPENMTPQQLADAATLVGSLPPEEQQRLMNAAAASSRDANNDTAVHTTTSGDPNLSTVSQLQQVANASQSAASASSLEDAAAKSRLGFDQAIGGAAKPGVVLTGTVVASPGAPQTQLATANTPASEPSKGSTAKPVQSINLSSSHSATKTEPVASDAPKKIDIAASPCPPGIAKIVPSRQQLQKELAVRHAQLESLTNTIIRLNRTVQLDQQQYAVWEDEASAAVARLKGRIWDLATTAALDGFIDLKEARYEAKEKQKLLTALDRDQRRKLGLLKDLKTFDDYKKWALENQGDWEQIDGGIRQLIDTLPLSSEASFYVQCAQQLIDNAYDVTDFVVTWDNVQQLDRNSTRFLEAVRQNGTRMKMIVGKIKEIEAQLNSTPAGPPNTEPCRGIPATTEAQIKLQ